VTSREPPHEIIERTGQPTFVLDPAKDRFVAANEAACAMLGYTRANLLATPVSSVHRGELPQLRAAVADVLRHGHTATNTLTCRTIAGKCLPVAMSLAAFELDGRVLVLGLVHDLSEHRAEERLRPGSVAPGILAHMLTKALVVRLEAKPGKEAELDAFLRDALPLVQDEPQTVTWLALRLSHSLFAIVDTFPDDQGREAHLDGAVASALMARAGELLAAPPDLQPADVLTAKLP